MIASELPTTNERWRMNFLATTDADGKILITGRRSASAGGGINVFLNALRLAEPQIRILKMESFDGFDLVLTIEAIDPAATHRVEEKTELSQADWTNTPDVFWANLGGRTIRATFSLTYENRFYRIVQDPAP
jgi:hypothetical protein